MAQKRTSPQRRPSKSSKRTQRKHQAGRVIGGLVLLVLVVVTGAVMAYYLIPRPSPRVAKVDAPPAMPIPVPRVTPAEKPVPPVIPPDKQVPPITTPEKPTYEIFPEKPVPPRKPLQRPTPLPGTHLPMVAIVIDDIGYDRQIAEQLLNIDAPLTFSMLPHSPFSREIIAHARAKGFEIMLHLPMEPHEFPTINPGPGAILTGMSPDELIAQVIENIDQVPGLKGVNNHMGSRISTSPERMRQIFSILKKRGLFYIDSRTTADTVAKPSAQLLELPFAERDIFIDHHDDPAFIQGQLEKLFQRAQTQGYAIGIAHPHPNTLKALAAFVPKLEGKALVVPASLIVQTAMLAESEKATMAQGKP